MEFARSFHIYSLNNVLLILAKSADATRVAGFRQWHAKARQAGKGEKSINIFGYREKKPNCDDGADEVTASDERVVRYFPALSIFDIT